MSTLSSLVKIELLKLRTTRYFPLTVLGATALCVIGTVTTIELAGKDGAPAIGTVENASAALGIAAVTSMVALVLGIVTIAGEYRHRTAVGTYLGAPRRSEVLVAKLVTVAGIAAALGAVLFGIAYAITRTMYAAKGVHEMPVDVPRLWFGTILGTACYGLLGVALGALTRSTVAAIIAAVVWMQVVEITILDQAFPAVGKWLPTGAGHAMTSSGADVAQLLSPAMATVVLVAWTAVIAAAAAKLTLNREIR